MSGLIPDPPDFEEQLALCEQMERESITLPLSKEMAILLASKAVSEDRTPEYIAAQVLRRWADEQIRVALALHEVLKRGGKQPGDDEPRTERDFEVELAHALGAVGLAYRTQVNTGAGIADIVIYENQLPVAVIEVKLEFRAWRDVHQAVGQATAYAKTLTLDYSPLVFVTAPRIDPKLIGSKVPELLPWLGAANVVKAAVEKLPRWVRA